MRYRWSVAPARTGDSRALSAAHGVSPLFAQCLLNRGVSPGYAEFFLNPRLKNLADPFLIPDMGAAVDRLILARERQELVVIFGDYDVDGVTSTVLLTEALAILGWKAEHYLPHRRDEGYGLGLEAIENCLRKYPSLTLLLAVDCGSTAVETIQNLREKNIDTIVLDHHQPGPSLPPAVALVNPHRTPGDGQDGPPSFRELCAAGLSFKLVHALLKRGRDLGWPAAGEFDLRPLTELVALGTIADIVPLTGENRAMVTHGLERLNRSQRQGVAALRTAARIEGAIGCYEVAFQLGPRLNAAGRLETAEEALRLLRARDPAEARTLAESLDARNAQRQQIEKQIVNEVSLRMRSFVPQNNFVIVEGDPGWHLGVVGIVASRVLQEFYRPTIILGGDGAEWRGSGRSIEGFDLAAGLRDCGDLLLRHGGHAMAAGVSIAPEKVETFRARLNDLARQRLAPELLQPKLRIDAEVSTGDLSLERVLELERLQPTGAGNPAVHFVLRNVSHQRTPQRMGNEQQHAKFWVGDGNRGIEAVWWNCGPNAAFPKVSFDLAFTPQVNYFNGRQSVQLKILDWNPVAGH